METRCSNRITGFSNIKKDQHEFHNGLPKKLKRLYKKDSYCGSSTSKLNTNSYQDFKADKMGSNKVHSTQSMYLGREVEDYKTINTNNTLSLSLGTMTCPMDDEIHQNQNMNERNSHRIKRKASTVSSALAIPSEQPQEEHQQHGIDINSINKDQIDAIRKSYELESKYMESSDVGKRLLRMTYFSDRGCSLLNEVALNPYERALLHIAREIHGDNDSDGANY